MPLYKLKVNKKKIIRYKIKISEKFKITIFQAVNIHRHKKTKKNKKKALTKMNGLYISQFTDGERAVRL